MKSRWRMLGSRTAQSYLCLKNDQRGEQIRRAKQIGRKSVRRLLQLMRKKMTAAPAGVDGGPSFLEMGSWKTSQRWALLVGGA